MVSYSYETMRHDLGERVWSQRIKTVATALSNSGRGLFFIDEKEKVMNNKRNELEAMVAKTAAAAKAATDELGRFAYFETLIEGAKQNIKGFRVEGQELVVTLEKNFCPCYFHLWEVGLDKLKDCLAYHGAEKLVFEVECDKIIFAAGEDGIISADITRHRITEKHRARWGEEIESMMGANPNKMLLSRCEYMVSLWGLIEWRVVRRD